MNNILFEPLKNDCIEGDSGHYVCVSWPNLPKFGVVSSIFETVMKWSLTNHRRKIFFLFGSKTMNLAPSYMQEVQK